LRFVGKRRWDEEDGGQKTEDGGQEGKWVTRNAEWGMEEGECRGRNGARGTSDMDGGSGRDEEYS
jgi:hypothetical protein